MTTRISNGPQQELSRPAGRKWIQLTLAGVLAAGLIVGFVYFFGGSVPAEVELDATVIAAATPDTSAGTQSTTANGSSVTTAPAGSAESITDVSGSWSVDTTTGTFSFEEATASFAGFRVQEELVQIGASTAVGRTPDISGTVIIDGTTIVEAVIQVDLTTIVSNESRREDSIQEVLDTGANPIATFVLTQVLDFGEVPSEGITVTATAVGDLTINGVTRSVEIPLEAQVAGDSILVVGSTKVVFSDFEVETPSAPIVLSLADEGTIELQLWLVRP